VNELALAAFAAARDEHAVDHAARSRRFAAFCRNFDRDEYLGRLEVRGIRWVARSDARFPTRLRSIHDPPPGLFVRGARDVDLLERLGVAIVGARSCSDYGAHVARSFAEALGRSGVVVVSGLARGVDGWAHRGVLDAGGDTIAVLGCGIDRDYPRAHSALASRIVGSGLIVSEYPPGVEPAPWRFPARKRRASVAKPFSLNHAVVAAVDAAESRCGVVPVWYRESRLVRQRQGAARAAGRGTGCAAPTPSALLPNAVGVLLEAVAFPREGPLVYDACSLVGARGGGSSAR